MWPWNRRNHNDISDHALSEKFEMREARYIGPRASFTGNNWPSDLVLLMCKWHSFDPYSGVVYV